MRPTDRTTRPGPDGPARRSTGQRRRRRAAAGALVTALVGGLLAALPAAPAWGAEPAAHFPLNATSRSSDTLNAGQVIGADGGTWLDTHVELGARAHNDHVAGDAPSSARVSGDALGLSLDFMLPAAQPRATTSESALLVYGGRPSYTQDSIVVHPYHAPGTAAAVVYQGGTPAVTVTFDAPAADVWHNLAVSLDGSPGGSLDVYLDGELVGKAPSAGIGADEVGNQMIRIGRDKSPVNILGSYRDLSVFAQPLTADDAEALSATNAAFGLAALQSRLSFEDGDSLTSDLRLPSGAGIEWEVPDGQTALTADGAVTRPPVGEDDAEVELTLRYRGLVVDYDLTVAARVEVADPTEALLASYDFSETDGTTLHDVSGAGRDAVVVGGAAWGGGFMEFTGANHVELPDGLLAGSPSATIVVETSPVQLSGNRFLWNIGGSGPDAQGQFFVHPVAPRVTITPTNWQQEQTATSSVPLEEGRWQSVAATIGRNDDGTTSTLRLYIDGVLVAEKTDSSTHLDDLATHTMNYLGKSAYPDDALYRGEVSAFHVYDEALSAEQIELVAEADAAAAAQERVAAIDLQAANTQPLSRIESDLVLPTAGGVSWTAQPASVISPEGAVTLPAEDTVVTLTATATVRGQSASREFEVTVLREPTPAERAARAVAGIVLPSVVEDGFRLPSSAFGVPVAWELVDGEGSVDDGVIDAGPERGFAAITVEAVAGTGPDTATSTFELRVAEDSGHTVAAYTTSANTRGASDPEVTLTGHLALSSDGEQYTALNSGAGVVFPRVSGMTEQTNGTKRYLADPYLFRLAGDDGFGLVARRVGASGLPVGDDQRHLLVFTSPDLVQWTELDPLVLPGAGAVGAVAAEWDPRLDAYRVLWTDPSGLTVSGSTESFGDVVFLGPALVPEGRIVEIDVPYANPASVVPVTADEARAAEQRLGRVHNTSVDAPEDIELSVGEDLALPEKVSARYSDGGTYELPVTWDDSQVDTSTPGQYEVTGTVAAPRTVFPLLPGRADPHMLRYTMPDGERTWLYIATDEGGQDELFIRQADTIEGITTAADHRILGIGLSGTAPVGSQLWAPELHEIDGDLYILFAANSNNVNSWRGVQAYTMRLPAGGDPLVRGDWETPQRVVDADGEPLTEYGTGITLDMTYFEDEGTRYAMWSERHVPQSGIGPAVLKIATVETSTDGPWRLTSERRTIAFPDRGWSANTSEVVEGPFAIQRDGRVTVTFSGSNVDWTYGVGVMTAESGADLLDPASWETRSYPIWHYEGPIGNNWGPGHNAYAYDDDGNLFNIFHAKATQQGSRDSGARMVYFRTDGTPILDMTDEEWLATENREVTVRVTVAATTGPVVSVVAQPRCVVGRTVVAAQVVNDTDVPVEVTVASPYGTRTVPALGSGRGTAVAFTTRLAEIPAGEVTVTATATVGGETTTSTTSAAYPASTCG